jgi:hypothetical protein
MGRNSSASTDVEPSPSAEVMSTFGAATSNPRVSVLIDRLFTDTMARSRYLPGGNC